jgi:hypothetical protein
MVALAVLTLVATIAFAGFRQNEFAGQYRRFVADVEGAMVRARNLAIDEQTRVRVTVSSNGLVLASLNPEIDNQWRFVDQVVMSSLDSALLMVDNRVCIAGLAPGVQTPAQQTSTTLPSACSPADEVLFFEPDGTFTAPAGLMDGAPNVGVSLWVADFSVSDQTRLAVVQVFPGGLVRRIEGVQ